MKNSFKVAFLLVIHLSIFCPSHAKESQEVATPKMLDQLLHTTVRTRIDLQGESQDSSSHFIIRRAIIAGFLCFVAASLSSAGGIGGGGLFIPILTMVGGLDLKTATSFSALMVTGSSIPNVVSSMLKHNGDKPLIDFDIALLLEPCSLLGVSVGVICNISFPEWLITMIFVVVLVWSTFKTLKSGVKYWKLESQGISRDSCEGQKKREFDIPWGDLAVLAMIWFSFCLLYLFRGNRYRRGLITLRSCGVGYWIISAVQVPLAIILTSWMLYTRGSLCNHQELDGVTNVKVPNKIMYPAMGLLVGALGGTFGIGGGMLISPLLLQVGLPPRVTSATSSFMVFFSSSMSAFQYILLGMEHIDAAGVYSASCFVGSVVGLGIIQGAIEKHGRPSLIVFSVGLVLALSTVLMTSFGGIRVWHDYRTKSYMGFKQPC